MKEHEPEEVEAALRREIPEGERWNWYDVVDDGWIEVTPIRTLRAAPFEGEVEPW